MTAARGKKTMGNLSFVNFPRPAMMESESFRGRRGGAVMMIKVMYKDGSTHLVSPRFLDRLLSSDEIFAFRRSSGWVVVSRDRLRENGEGNGYTGQERRLKH
jgi:hypothetical protein